jgi:hypothetical protein
MLRADQKKHLQYTILACLIACTIVRGCDDQRFDFSRTGGDVDNLRPPSSRGWQVHDHENVRCTNASREDVYFTNATNHLVLRTTQKFWFKIAKQRCE